MEGMEKTKPITGKKCIVVGASPEECQTVWEPVRQEDAYLICADGGLDKILQAGLLPHLVVGDFDSSRCKIPEGVEQIRLPAEKDDTDLLFAVKEGLRRGYRDFQILGALGARLDHSYANFGILQYISQQNGTGMLEDDATCVYLLDARKKHLFLEDCEGITISVFPFAAPSCTLTYEGMRYPLDREVLSSNFPRGISNVIAHPCAKITVHEGQALVMLMKRI